MCGTGYSKRMHATRYTWLFARRSGRRHLFRTAFENNASALLSTQRSFVTEEVAPWLGAFLLEEFVSFAARGVCLHASSQLHGKPGLAF